MSEGMGSEERVLRKRVRNDIILVAALLLAALLVLTVFRLAAKNGAYAVISRDGREIMRLSLSVDTERVIPSDNGGFNTVRISEGRVSVSEASCPDGICARHKPIRATNESIVCLPNRLTVYVAADSSEADIYT